MTQRVGKRLRLDVHTLERSTDVLRALVDDQRIQLPWDRYLQNNP